MQRKAELEVGGQGWGVWETSVFLACPPLEVATGGLEWPDPVAGPFLTSY